MRFIVRGRNPETSEMEELVGGNYGLPVPAVRRADAAYGKCGYRCVDVLAVNDDGHTDRIYLRRDDSALVSVTNSFVAVVEKVA